jgi:NAD(P)-dependent dehydrogenase (short-subunit alcohol dehydrogenase family)
VTGAAAGIGHAIARRFAKAGADVLLVDIDAEALDQAAGALDARAASFVADLSDPAAPARVLASCEEQLGPVDVLVNNAGIYPFAMVADLSPEVIDRILALNLRGTILMSQAAALSMAARGNGGAIVNIAAVGGHVPFSPGLLAYGASKAGVHAATRGLALELASAQIRVNSVSPGPILNPDAAEAASAATGLDPEQMEALAAEAIAGIPMGRMGSPDDIAEAVLFLASDAASFITGTDLVVDGGTMLQ